MELSLSDEILAGFLGGLVSVFTILGIGALIYLILFNLKRRYPFLRLAISLSLAPLTMVNFIGEETSGTLYLYILVIMLIGLAIDGSNYLLIARSNPETTQEPETETRTPEEDPDGLAWDRAEK